MHIENRISSRLRQVFETTLPRFDLMALLERNPEGLRMSEISGRLMVSSGNVTGIADQLERQGLVVRTQDSSDRRAVTVRLTEAGLKKFCEMSVYHEQWIVELLGGFNREEKQTLFALLKNLKTHMIGTATVALAQRGSIQTHRRK
jgi:DNA-binding MarR family transcriptional regulator